MGVKADTVASAATVDRAPTGGRTGAVLVGGMVAAAAAFASATGPSISSGWFGVAFVFAAVGCACLLAAERSA